MDSLFKTYGCEGLYIEYKEKLPNPPALAKAMISFSNTKGGRIIIGVEDKTGDIIGVDTKMDIEEYVMNVAAQNCEPIISPMIELHSFKDKLVVIIDVPAGVLKPYHLKNKTVQESTYIRIGSTNRSADKNHIQQLLREAVNESFDRSLAPNTTANDLDLSKVEKYQELKHARLGTPKENISASFLKKIGIKNDAAVSSPVTVGGLLLFGRSPQGIHNLSRAYIKIGRFNGKDVGDIIDHDVLEGTLDEQIENAVQFVRKHMFVSGKISGLKRDDRPTYPLAAIREVVTNAVIHRDYSRASSEAIMLRIFDDRIEAESPGLLPIGVRVENLGQAQNTRNPLVARSMFDMNYFDEWGQGINRIIRSCHENDNPAPRFEEKDSTFMVTIFARRKELRYDLKERRKLIMEHLEREKEIGSKGYQKLTGASPAQAAKDFRVFLKEKLIKRTGKGRSVKYS